MNFNFENIYNNTFIMLNNRGYNITPMDCCDYVNGECKYMIFGGLLIIFNEKMGTPELKVLKNTIEDNKINHVIFILVNKIANPGKKKISDYENVHTEFFLYSDLVINIIEHRLVPRHELLSDQKRDLILKKFGKKIPYIKTTDKIARYYNAKPNQVFKIYRKHELYFRIVVA